MKNLKYIPTKKLKSILDDPYCRGIDGKDYMPVKDELEQLLWLRQERDERKRADELEAQAYEYQQYMEETSGDIDL